MAPIKKLGDKLTEKGFAASGREMEVNQLEMLDSYTLIQIKC